MASAGSQLKGWRLHTGGRRVTTGAAGVGRKSKRQTDKEEAIVGERDYARENCLVGKVTRVDIGGGGGGSDPSF